MTQIRVESVGGGGDKDPKGKSREGGTEDGDRKNHRQTRRKTEKDRKTERGMGAREKGHETDRQRGKEGERETESETEVASRVPLSGGERPPVDRPGKHRPSPVKPRPRLGIRGRVDGGHDRQRGRDKYRRDTECESRRNEDNPRVERKTE